MMIKLKMMIVMIIIMMRTITVIKLILVVSIIVMMTVGERSEKVRNKAKGEQEQEQELKEENWERNTHLAYKMIRRIEFATMVQDLCLFHHTTFSHSLPSYCPCHCHNKT